MNSLDPDTGALAIIVVTYNPDIQILRTQLTQLPTGAMRIIVDNASAPELLVSIRELASKNDVHVITNITNLGIATAINQGIGLARELRCSSFLLLDQDTEPGFGGVAGLQAAYRKLLAKGLAPGCIGPRLVDAMTGEQYGFHCIRGWRWVREYPAAGTTDSIECANLNGSGTLIPIEVLERLGGLQDDFFIDHVDTEWSFRVLDGGFGLYGAPDVTFRHRMGEHSMRFWWFGWRVWPYRSPQRHYYLFRNAIRLMRRDYVPAVWKAWAIAKLALTCLAHLVFDHQRFQQTGEMLRGAWAGCSARQSWRIQ